MTQTCKDPKKAAPAGGTKTTTLAQKFTKGVSRFFWFCRTAPSEKQQFREGISFLWRGSQKRTSRNRATFTCIFIRKKTTSAKPLFSPRAASCLIYGEPDFTRKGTKWLRAKFFSSILKLSFVLEALPDMTGKRANHLVNARLWDESNSSHRATLALFCMACFSILQALCTRISAFGNRWCPRFQCFGDCETGAENSLSRLARFLWRLETCVSQCFRTGFSRRYSIIATRK